MPPRRQARMCSGNETTEVEAAGNANTISRLSRKVTDANSSALPHLLTAKTEHNVIKCESEEKSSSVWERIKACCWGRKAEVAIKESNRQYEADKAREAAQQRRFAAAIKESNKRHIIEYEADKAREAANRRRFAAAKDHQMFIYKQQLKKAILEHDDSGRLSCFVILDGTMYIDCAETFNTIHNNIINELNFQFQHEQLPRTPLFRKKVRVMGMLHYGWFLHITGQL